MDFEKEIKGVIAKITKLKEVPLEVPPSYDMGDYGLYSTL